MTSRGYWTLFLASSVVCGFAFWWQTDWWAHVIFPDGPRRKFEMPLEVQLSVSSFVGFVGGAVVVALVALARSAWLWLRTGSSGRKE